MRMQFNAIIYIDNGFVNLTNVNFTNIHTNGSGFVIGSGGLNNVEDNSLVFQGGIVELLNNGYEIISANPLPGFLYIQYFNYVTLKNIEFRYNIATMRNSPLIFLSDIYVIEMEDLVFTCNYISLSSIIEIQQNFLNMPINNSESYQIATDISLYNNSFINNTSISVLTIPISSICQSININYNIFESNLGSGNLINIYYSNTLSTLCIYGGNITVTDISNPITIPGKSINITNSIFINNYQSTLLNINNIPNLNLLNISYENNGNILDTNLLTIKQIKTYPNAYLSLNIISSSITCISLITLSSIYSLQITLWLMDNNNCTLLSLTSIYNSISFNSSSFSNNKLYTSADFITISSNISTVLANLTFTNNTVFNANNQMLSLIQENNEIHYTLNDIYFYNCSNGIKANEISNLIVNNLTVIKAQSQIYSALYLIGATLSTLFISNSHFIKNKSTIISITSV